MSTDMSTELTLAQIKSVKGDGFLINRGTRQFSARVVTGYGRLTAAQLAVLKDASEKYGNGSILFTVRLTVEVPGIDFDDIHAFKALIATAGLKTGGTGPKVRPVVACKGTTCTYGLYDTQKLAEEIHRRFYEGRRDMILPHKFKIAVGGCPNSCVKPELNDIGIVGQSIPSFDTGSCKSCKNCNVSHACPTGAAAIVDGSIHFDKDSCINCGQCAGKCPFDVTDSLVTCYKVYVGGKWGRSVRIGTALDFLVSAEDIIDLIDRTLQLYKNQGITGERFGDTCDRLGMDAVNKALSAK